MDAKFSWNESSLLAFIRSGDPATTEKHEFYEVHRRLTIKLMSEKTGLGLRLTDSAEPGQLLIVENAISSCACIREYAPYIEGSYVHAPKVAWKPPRPRIPPTVHGHLVAKIVRYLATANLDDYFDVVNLDSHDPSNWSSPRHDKPGTRRVCEIESPEELQEAVWRIVGNNAILNKVRSLDLNEPQQVETCEMWGVWVLPSFINHSCAPNCHQMRVGKAMLIRAAKEIAAGEELTLPYFDIFEPLAIRDANCRTFGFRCECQRCTFERSLGAPYNDLQTQIVQLKIELETQWKGNAGSGGKADALLQELARCMGAIDMVLQGCHTMQPTESTLTRGSKSKKKWKKQLKESKKQRSMKEAQMASVKIMHMQQNWVEASFIDAPIAVYALCAGRPSTALPECLDPFAWFEDIEIAPTEEGQHHQMTAFAATQVLMIINGIHPGNMLGQEFYPVLLEAIRRVADSYERLSLEDRADDCAFELKGATLEAWSAYLRYYGCGDDYDVFNLLLKTKS